jgi:hypothetical protein
MDGYVYWNVEIFDFGECEGIDEFWYGLFICRLLKKKKLTVPVV